MNLPINSGIIFIAQILLLFWLSRILIQRIGGFVARLTHSRRITMYVLALIFLPGTLVHELAHLIVARLIGVHTGAISIWPREEEHGFRLGAVAIANTDAARRLLIGVAPFLVGVGIMLSTIWFVYTQGLNAWWHYLIAIYVVFELGNTMFSSKKDLEGTGIAIILFAAIAVVMYFIGVRIPEGLSAQTGEVLKTASIFLLVPIGIDLVLVLISKLR